LPPVLDMMALFDPLSTQHSDGIREISAGDRAGFVPPHPIAEKGHR